MPRKPRVAKRPARDETLVDGYVRVSTDEQSREGASLETQIEKIRGYCELYDLRLAKIVADPGESGKSLDRPGVAEVLDDLATGRVDGVVVAKLDRLTRSLADWTHLISRFFCERAGRQLHSVTNQIDTRTANGRMMLNLIMSIAEWEREIIAERTKEVLQGKIRRGERCGKVRYGYELTEDGRTLRPDPAEQSVIDQMRVWRKTGHTYQEIVRLLAELGIETKEGGVWFPATIHRILSRPIA